MNWKKSIGIAVLLVVLLAYGARIAIYHQAVQAAENAVEQYEGDRVEALLMMLKDPTVSLEDKNMAIWALGQIGDTRAVTTLKSLYTGEPCDHTSRVCQHELEKALRACNGGWDLMFWK